ncbi:MAG: AbaSI family restriction endonuclease [Candidatus Paceibacterota bacterium]
MDKFDYILRQFSRTNKKNYENYVITRIFTKLDDISIKFITQQAVIGKNNKRYLTDLYFPQLNVHIEIDEGHHKKNEQAEKDVARDADIVSVTEHNIERIDVFNKNIEDVNDQIDKIVSKLKDLKKEKEVSGKFNPWDLKKEFNPQTYIDKGYIDLEEGAAFRCIYEALNCFGYNYKGYQRGFAQHPIEKDKALWFPKLYKNDGWDNDLIDGGEIILERKEKGNKKRLEIFLHNPKHGEHKKRIVFAHAKDSLGRTLYRFKGVFELNIKESQKKGHAIYKRTRKKVKTYSYSENK